MQALNARLFFMLEQVLHSRALLLMAIEEFQILTSFILHMIQQIQEECFCKENLKRRVLNEV